MGETVSVSTLTYNNSIVGYRLQVTSDSNSSKYYDLNVSVAEKYGLAKGMTGIEVPLINYDGMLLSRQEKELNVTVEDVSNNTAFLKRISALKSNKRNDGDIKAKIEQDKRKAMQMDKFNKLLMVCLNLIANSTRIKKVGSYNVLPLNLDNEIDSILVSQGVFTTGRSLNNRIKAELISYMSTKGYSYVNVAEYTKKGSKNTVVNNVIAKYNTKDLLIKDIR